jgi:hypothetical protein
VRVLPSGAGESLLVKAHASFVGVTYLRRHSLENGAVLASERVGHSDNGGVRWDCQPAAPGRIWCVETINGIRLRDAESLETIATQEQMLRGVPAPVRPSGIGGTTVYLGPGTVGLVFEDREGYRWVIDPTTLTPTRFPSGPGASMTERAFPSPDPPVNTGDRYSFTNARTGGTRGALVRRERSWEDGVVLHPEHTYLRGRIVAGLDDPPRVLVTEYVPDHGLTLWCLFADGSVQWKVPRMFDDEFEVVHFTKLYRDMIVLVTYTQLIALRAQDGAVAWTSPP